MKKIIFIFFFHLLLFSIQAMQDAKNNSASQGCSYKEKKLKPKKNFHTTTNANTKVMPNNNHNLLGSTGLGGSIALFYYYTLRKTDN